MTTQTVRRCSECDGIVPGNSRSTRLVCSDLCKSRRSQRLRHKTWKQCARPDCGKQFSTKAPEQKHCSRSCARRAAARVIRPTKPCGSCGRPTENEKYCSTPCTARGRANAALQRWIDGLSAPADGRLTDTAKQYLASQVGYKCTACGWGQSNEHGEVTLSIVRLDGNKRNAARSNITLRCLNCVTLTGAVDISSIVSISRKTLS